MKTHNCRVSAPPCHASPTPNRNSHRCNDGMHKTRHINNTSKKKKNTGRTSSRKVRCWYHETRPSKVLSHQSPRNNQGAAAWRAMINIDEAKSDMQVGFAMSGNVWATGKFEAFFFSNHSWSFLNIRWLRKNVLMAVPPRGRSVGSTPTAGRGLLSSDGAQRFPSMLLLGCDNEEGLVGCPSCGEKIHVVQGPWGRGPRRPSFWM